MRCTVPWIALLLSGCAAYQPLPLPDQPALARDPSHLRIDTATLPTKALRTHRFDPSDGWDMTEVAMVAVAENPELKALRAEAGVARAQAFSAGLLPDPLLTFSNGVVMASSDHGTTAFAAGLNVDLAALLVLSSARSAGAAEDRQTDLNLLWQEWLTVAKARLLFVKLTAVQQSLTLLGEQRALLQPRLDRTRMAVDRGLIATDVFTPQLAALQDVERQHNDLERQANQGRHDLNALLGLAPDLTVQLVEPPDLSSLDAAKVQGALAEATRRRPDLLALQAGYEAENARYRGTLLAQFPAITFGPLRARDNSDVNTVGFAMGITLPIFNRNRGHIEIERATREKLWLDYQQRLDSALSDAHRLLAEDAILRRQRLGIDAAIVALSRVAGQAQAAFSERSIDALTLTSAESALLAKRLERVAVEQALWEQEIALQTLAGTEIIVPESGGKAKS